MPEHYAIGAAPFTVRSTPDFGNTQASFPLQSHRTET